MPLFDTDVLIFHQRGHAEASHILEAAEEPAISLVTYLELLQGGRGTQELRRIKSLLADYSFKVHPLSENIGHRAAIIMESHGARAGLGLADALIAATALELDLDLATANRKHYAGIPGLRLRVFHP